MRGQALPIRRAHALAFFRAKPAIAVFRRHHRLSQNTCSRWRNGCAQILGGECLRRAR
jgi:hypothetical protein